MSRNLRDLSPTMGAKLPPPHRCFNMRNPFARAVVLAVVALALVSAVMRTGTADVRRVVMKAATSKNSLFQQQPLNSVSKTPNAGKAGHMAVTNATMYAVKCDDDMEHLRGLRERYGLGSQFEYYKRYFRLTRQDVERKSLTKLDQRLMPHQFRLIDTEEDSGSSSQHTCAEPVEVPVSKSAFPSTANLSDFMFGVSTTYKRFTDPKTSSINEWSYWLTDQQGRSNGGKLVLFLMGASSQELDDAWTQLEEVGIDADVYYSDPSEEMAVRYLSLVPALYEHEERPRKKWLVTCDDDTFFPSPHALVDKFAEFNASNPMYVGTLSEDINNVDRHGSQAFGGAGVFISVPLAGVIAERFEDCASDQKIKEANTGWGPQGDILLRKCIYENTDVRLRTVWDLWQLDLFGDPSGFYESGIRPLSLHHYRGGGWHVAHPFQYTKLAHLCGEDCLMQRFQTADDWVVSTSFSLAHYPHGTSDLDLSQFERTFGAAPDDKGWNMDFMLGPQRKALHRTGRKISWDLQESTVNPDGSVSQVYVRKADDWRWVYADGSPMRENDGVFEVVWIS